jgi:hypothetical protein
LREEEISYSIPIWPIQVCEQWLFTTIPSLKSLPVVEKGTALNMTQLNVMLTLCTFRVRFNTMLLTNVPRLPHNYNMLMLGWMEHNCLYIHEIADSNNN